VPEPAILSVRRILRVCLSLAIVTGISLAEFRLGRVNHTTVALTLLLAVLAIATWWGLLESLVASAAGMLCFNYLFLPPVGTWTIADPQNWVALITFVGTATVASQLSASAKRRAVAQARAEEAATRAEAARQSEEMKSAMLDALAHEFKTPLTSIKAAVSSHLGDESAAPAHKELLQVVDEEADRLTWLVEEAVQIARIETGRMELRKQPQAVVQLIREALERMAGALESRIVEVRASDAIPPVPADRELVLIVLRQLLDNAAKYSTPGSPIVISAAEKEGSVVVTVTDRGPGVPQADLNRVFEKFYRGPHARERAPGTGMGLAIAREIVRGHGGDLRVVSRAGQGSEFSFALPPAGQEPRP
jgi:two-component system sensor histidine kinase KdpD